MTPIVADYKDLMQSYLDHRRTTKTFMAKFIEMFKNEEREMDGDTFEVLDELFGATDSFTDDATLLEKKPEFYVNEHGLRTQVAQALARLS